MLPIWLLAALMIMIYYWRFWEPWADAMLVVVVVVVVAAGVVVVVVVVIVVVVVVVVIVVIVAVVPVMISNTKPKFWQQDDEHSSCPGFPKKSPVPPMRARVLQKTTADEISKVATIIFRQRARSAHWRDGKIFWEPWADAMLVVLLPKLWFWIGIMTGTSVLGCLPGAHSYWAQKSFKINNFYIIDWIRKKLLVDVANLATCCYDDCDVLLEVLGTLRKCYVSRPVAKTLVLDWKSWLAQVFLGVFLGLTLTGPKKASKSTILYNRLNKEKTPGRCCQSGYLLLWWLWCTIIGGLGTLRKCYVGSPVAKALVRDWKSWLAQLLLDVFPGLTLTGHKKASKSTIFI